MKQVTCANQSNGNPRQISHVAFVLHFYCTSFAPFTHFDGGEL